jgi:uncharacterized protein (TIGR03435 family)
MRAAVALLLVFAQAVLAAQTASFEVVSIKPSDEKANARFTGTGVRGNRWTGTRVTLLEILRDSRRSEGFDMPDRIAGGPGWIDKDLFDVAATTAGEAPARAELEAMIRAMLAERFHLVAHMEKKTLAAYELVRLRPGTLGPKLRRSEADCNPRCGVMMMFGPPNRLRSEGMDIARLASLLSSQFAHRPVLDRTGLDGQFAMDVEFAAGAELTNAPPSDAPSIFTALEEQLGLKLKPVKAPLDVLVVDRAEKPAFD